MKRNARLPNAALAGLAAIGLALATGGFIHVALGQKIPTEADAKRAEQKKPDHSPYPNQHFPNRDLLGRHASPHPSLVR
jgi:hypothetical protein